MTYDAIIVGSRIAGATTAMLLARAGYKVLVVDRATLPSDTTHLTSAGIEEKARRSSSRNAEVLCV